MAIEKLEIYQPLTVADYHAYVESLLPEEPTPELMNGGIVLAARPTIRHARYLRELLGTINAYVREHQLIGEVFPEVEVVLEKFTVLVPDLAFLSFTTGQARLDDERIIGAPDFVCEISSPRTRRYDATEKFLAYLRAGVREYWIVDPAHDPGERFRLYERIPQESPLLLPSFQLIAGGPDQSRIFPGIAIAQGLL
jgi:Uma2 family endonuclease